MLKQAKIVLTGQGAVEKKDRAIDALSATKAAVQSGILRGSGNTTYEIAQELMASDQMGDILVGKALTGIVAALAQNSGINSQYAFEKMKQKKFFDASKRTFSNAQLSVFDATESLRSAIQEGADVV